LSGHSREVAVALVNVAILLLVAIATHGFFTADNLLDLFLANMPVILIALGMTLVIVTGQIDISVGSVFAVCSVLAGMTARAGAPLLVYVLVTCVAGTACGALNGALTAYVRLPSIVVTLATMVALRDGLRWQTQGAWVGDLPAGFVQLGMGQTKYTLAVAVLTLLITVGFALGLRYLRAGRAVFATGANAEAAREIGIDTHRVVFTAFTLTGALTGLAAVLNAVRFREVPSNSGIGMEMKVIAAVVVGGAAITGGSATVTGTLLGVILLGVAGPALTFLGVSAYWENALQGGIILVAVSANGIGRWRRRRAEVAVAR
jgi:rhamnose transport system permease protein